MIYEQEFDHIATGSESLAEFARNAGMDNQDCCWLLDSRDVWVRNPYYNGPDQPHPEDDRGDFVAENNKSVNQPQEKIEYPVDNETPF